MQGKVLNDFLGFKYIAFLEHKVNLKKFFMRSVHSLMRLKMYSRRKRNIQSIILVFLVFALTLTVSCKREYDEDLYPCEEDDPFCNELEKEGIKWSGRLDGVNFEDAEKYCDEIGGRLPTIDELRSLIRNCPDTEPGGKCKLSEKCFDASTCQEGCEGCKSNGIDGYFSIFDDSRTLWSSTKLYYGEEGFLSSAVVVFNYIENTTSTMGAVVINSIFDSNLRVRCVSKNEAE
jgi:hypothetical protein